MYELNLPDDETGQAKELFLDINAHADASLVKLFMPRDVQYEFVYMQKDGRFNNSKVNIYDCLEEWQKKVRLEAGSTIVCDGCNRDT